MTGSFETLLRLPCVLFLDSEKEEELKGRLQRNCDEGDREEDNKDHWFGEEKALHG